MGLAVCCLFNFNIISMDESKNLDEKDYHISFFQPTTKLAKFNRNLSITLLTVWAVCIFGFQILLKIVEKPVPEIAYVEYEGVWDQVKIGQASDQEKQIFIKSALSVLGKVTLKPEDRAHLNSAVSKFTYELAGKSQKANLNNKIETLKEIEFGEPDYANHKFDLGSLTAKVINVEPYSLEAKLLPVELAAARSNIVNAEMVEMVMSKYLIHNQSFLTDYTFLGFPFHYFYTGVFLMILFVAICLYYCVATDKAMLRLGIKEE